MSLVLQSSGGGSVTLAEPTTASNFTQNLPAVDGTIITTGNRPAGSVLQVVSATNNTGTEIKTTDFTDTGLTATITPTSATSKILVLVSQPLGMFQNTNGDRQFFTRLLRGATAISNKESINYAGTAGNGYVAMTLDGSYVFLDSPATTSATTYKTQGRISNTANDTGMSINRGSTQSSIVLLEIAA
jgi:hypothetical protein